MPAPEAIITHGDVEDGTLVDEDNLLIQSMSYAPTRTKREFLGGQGYTRGVQYKDPKMAITFRAYVSEYAGLAAAHPGDEVSEMANFEATILGFDPSVGTLIYEDPTLEKSIDDADQLNGTVMHYPFVNN